MVSFCRHVRDVVGGKVRYRPVVGQFPGIANRGWRDIVVLADLPSEVILAADSDAFEIAVASNKTGKAAE